MALERYVKTVLLESDTLIEMLCTQVIPAGERQLEASAAAAAALEGGGKPTPLRRRVQQLVVALDDVIASADTLRERTQAGEHGDEAQVARRLADQVRPAMAAAREAADRLEHLVDDELWSIPKYREMLFIK